MDWQQLATPPPISGSESWERMVCAQLDWHFGNINYSQFLFALDDILNVLRG